MQNLSREALNAIVEAAKYHLLPAMVVANYNNGQSVEGQLMFTEGLAEALGFELVGYGQPSVESLKASVVLIYGNFRRGAAIDVTEDVLPILMEQVPTFEGMATQYRQYVVDESALDGETEDVSGDPLWIPEGGQGLLEQQELVNQIGAILSEREKSIFDRMDLIRKQYREKIATFGYTMAGVFDPGTPDIYIYSMGLSKKDLPELIVAGQLPMDGLQDFVAHFANKFLEEGFALEELKNVFTLDDDTAYSLRLVQVDPYAAVEGFLKQAPSVLEQVIGKVVWIQISDTEGRYPGDEGFDNKFNQPDIAPVISK